jgi:trans-2-enoyl-CoA reductase
MRSVRRCFGRGFSSLHAVEYSQNGVPQQVLQYKPLEATGKAGANQVKLKMLAAPINPSDINMIEGTYGVKSVLPAFGGNEGVAEVQEVGASVNGLSVGDWVIPIEAGLGTWRQELLADASKVFKVANDIPVAYAATLGVNPCTAYRMLNDFVALKEGDVIIQNGANSMVGLAIIQLARERGIRTINVVRSARPEVDNINQLLDNLGGDVNIPDTYLNSHGFNEILADLPPIKLALNCVGGEAATDLARALGVGGTMVTYGGMAKRPLQIPFDLITYKQLKLCGFWMAKWNTQHSAAERQVMLDYITTLIREEKLSFFFEMHDFDDFHHAFRASTESFHFRKVVLNLNYPDRMVEHDQKTTEDYWHFEAPVV